MFLQLLMEANTSLPCQIEDLPPQMKRSIGIQLEGLVQTSDMAMHRQRQRRLMSVEPPALEVIGLSSAQPTKSMGQTLKNTGRTLSL